MLAQESDPILMRVGETPITKSEFEYAYNKSQANGGKQNISPTEFLESYINLKLNVEEAKSRGLDNTEPFILEYSKYVEQSESPYLTDSISPIIVAKNIYEKLKENIEISQLFLKLPKGNILPKDTLAVYNKISNIRKSVINGDFNSFASLVKEYSEDSISKNSRIPGYMGWRTAFSAPETFENAMYSTEVNSVSDPIRIGDGYRLIWILNKKPDGGQLNIAHILFVYPDINATPEQKDSVKQVALMVLDKLQNGGDFAELCKKYSSDRRSAEMGGNLGWFGVYNPPPQDFADIIFSLKNVGELTPLINTGYGFHIFKLTDRIPMASWEEMKDEIIKKIPQSDRIYVLNNEKIKRLAQEYPYVLNTESYQKMQQVANMHHLSDSAFFDILKPVQNNQLLQVGNEKYTVSDFLSYLRLNPRSSYKLSTDILKYKTSDFILDLQTEAKRNDLPKNYPDLHHLIGEFYDGLLYFEIMSQEVWDKAQLDKSSLEKYFDQNREKYKWDSPRFKGYVIHAQNKKIISEIKSVINKNKKANNLQEILKTTLGPDTYKKIIIEKGLWAKGENTYVDSILYKTKAEKEMIGYPECIIEGELISSPEEYSDVMGLVVTDYQEILEKEWLEKLHKKYNVNVNDDVLKTIR